MIDNKTEEYAFIERAGEIRKDLTKREGYWISHELSALRDADIIEAVMKAGYKEGDKIHYRIIIPKKR